MLWKRVLSAAVGIPIAIYLIYLGELPFLIAMTILSVAAVRELNNIYQKIEGAPFKELLYLGAIIIPITAFFQEELLLFVFLLLVIILIFKAVIDYPKLKITDLSLTTFGFVYPSLLLSHLILIRQFPEHGFEYILLVFIITWSSDTGAYFMGRSFGKNKLAPQLSPKKTIEGAAGGILASVISTIIFAILTDIFSVLIALLIGIIGSVVAQIGDLIESALKRSAGIKDSGNLIPGHGGILDRFDSILLSAPTVYYIILLMSL